VTRRSRRRRTALKSKGERGFARRRSDLVILLARPRSPGDHRVAEGRRRRRESDPRTTALGVRRPPRALASGETVTNSIAAAASTAIDRGADLTVHETEELVLVRDGASRSTSRHSMVIYGEDRITPAKRGALALCELITTRIQGLARRLRSETTSGRLPLRESHTVGRAPTTRTRAPGSARARDSGARKRQTNARS